MAEGKTRGREASRKGADGRRELGIDRTSPRGRDRGIGRNGLRHVFVWLFGEEGVPREWPHLSLSNTYASSKKMPYSRKNPIRVQSASPRATSASFRQPSVSPPPKGASPFRLTMFAPSTLRRILNASTIQQCLPALRCSSTFPSPSSRPAASPFISSLYPSPSSAVRSSLSSPSTLISLRNHSSNPFSSQRRSLHTTPPASGPRDYDRKPPLPPTRFSKNYQVGKTKPPVGSGDPSKQGKWSYDRKGRTLLSAFADKLDKLEPDGVVSFPAGLMTRMTW
jgi:hypothetical protein